MAKRHKDPELLLSPREQDDALDESYLSEGEKERLDDANAFWRELKEMSGDADSVLTRDQ